MAITRVQVKTGGGDSDQGTSISTGNFGSSVTSGNTIIVFIRQSTDTVTGVPTDTLFTTYTLAKKQAGPGNNTMYIYYGVLASSGTNAVAVPFSVTNYAWVYAIEVSGLSATPLDQADGKTGTIPGGGDCVTNAITTTQDDEYVVLGVSEDAFGTYTAGTDFSLVDGTIPTNAANFGGVEERITSSALSSYVAHITSVSGAGNGYFLAFATFKGAAGGGASIVPLIMHHRKLMAA